MNNAILNETLELSLAGKIIFSEVVKRLAANGTERYIADLVSLKKIYYSNDGEVHETIFKFDSPQITQQFNAEEVESSIKDIQQLKINYKTFLKRIMSAGCTHYEVFINGKQAIYFGRDGSHHIELFPSVKSN